MKHLTFYFWWSGEEPTVILSLTKDVPSQVYSETIFPLEKEEIADHVEAQDPDYYSQSVSWRDSCNTKSQIGIFRVINTRKL